MEGTFHSKVLWAPEWRLLEKHVFRGICIKFCISPSSVFSVGVTVGVSLVVAVMASVVSLGYEHHHTSHQIQRIHLPHRWHYNRARDRYTGIHSNCLSFWFVENHSFDTFWDSPVLGMRTCTQGSHVKWTLPLFSSCLCRRPRRTLGWTRGRNSCRCNCICRVWMSGKSDQNGEKAVFQTITCCVELWTGLWKG